MTRIIKRVKDFFSSFKKVNNAIIDENNSRKKFKINHIMKIKDEINIGVPAMLHCVTYVHNVLLKVILLKTPEKTRYKIEN